MKIFGGKDTFKLEQVFTPGGQPSVTYVDRAHLGIESTLKKAIALPSTIVSLTGPTKSGKTVLCKSVLSNFEYVWVDGGQIKSEGDLWSKVCSELRLAAELVKKTSTSDQLGGTLGADIAMGALGINLKFGTTTNGSHVRLVEENIKFIPDTMHQAIDTLVGNNIALVIDDFHYIDEKTRADVIKSLKGAIFKGLKVVLLSTPHRAFEAIKAESEITGRFKHVEVPPWSVEDLTIIAQIGFQALNIDDNNSLIKHLAAESEGSPLLMQRFCWNICYDQQITQTCPNLTKLKNIDIDGLFNEVAADAGLPIYEKLAKGPQSRTDRIRRPLIGGSDADIYEAILLAVAMTGPKEKLTYDNIRSSLNSVLADKIPQKIEVSNALNHLTAIDKDENRGQRAIDWDPQSLNLVITDPFFRFYLRWKVAKLPKNNDVDLQTRIRFPE